MATVWRENSTIDSPPGDSSTESSDKTLFRSPPTPKPLPGGDSDHEDESPIMRLMRTRDHTNSQRPNATPSERPAGLPVTVLTTDAPFAAQLRAAFDGRQDVSVVATADEAAALAVSGRCPILITDAVLTRNALEALSTRLRSHDSATAIVVAGTRDQGGMLVSLQSAGVVDGFLLKPATAAATQIVVEAATRRYRSGADPMASATKVRGRTGRRPKSLPSAPEHLATETVEAKRSLHSEQLAPLAVVPARGAAITPLVRSRPSWTVVALIVAVIAVGATWFASQPPTGIDAGAIVTKHLALAEAALHEGRLLDVRDGAVRHFQTVLALEPNNFAALRGLDAVAGALSRDTQKHMSAQRLPEAAMSLDRLRDFQPTYAELPLLELQLRALQERLIAAHRAPEVEAAQANVSKPAAPVRRESRAPASIERKLANQPAARGAIDEPKPTAAPAREVARPVATTAPSLAQNSTSLSATAVEPAIPVAAQIKGEPILPPPSETRTASISPPPLRRSEPAPVAPEALIPPAQSTASDTPPLLKYVAPTYPAEALNRQMEGWIEISMEIAASGDVLHPRIEEGEKRQLFGRAALAAVKQWKYAPDATRPAGKRSSVRLEFKLE